MVNRQEKKIYQRISTLFLGLEGRSLIDDLNYHNALPKPERISQAFEKKKKSRRWNFLCFTKDVLSLKKIFSAEEVPVYCFLNNKC